MGETFASGTIPLPSDTLRVIEEKILLALGGGGGGSGGIASQIRMYSVDPNDEGVTPFDTTAPGVAYQENGAGPQMTWNPTTQLWM